MDGVLCVAPKYDDNLRLLKRGSRRSYVPEEHEHEIPCLEITPGNRILQHRLGHSNHINLVAYGADVPDAFAKLSEQGYVVLREGAQTPFKEKNFQVETA